jgi:hypothetical protein
MRPGWRMTASSATAVGAIRDERTGRILTARRLPDLLHASASYDGDLPVITLPDGRTVVGPGTTTDSALSEWLASLCR